MPVKGPTGASLARLGQAAGERSRRSCESLVLLMHRHHHHLLLLLLLVLLLLLLLLRLLLLVVVASSGATSCGVHCRLKITGGDEKRELVYFSVIFFFKRKEK